VATVDGIRPSERAISHLIVDALATEGVLECQGLDKGTKPWIDSQAPLARAYFGLLQNRARKSGL
jgi:hypothetical protein